MNNYFSGLGTRSHGKKTLVEAWERHIAEMADLVTAFPCVPTHFNPSVYYSISFHLQQTLHSQPSLEANKEAFNVNDSH